ncbi:MAG: 3-hydroxyacyl-CoA dehydrogenase NAD-binding domain-containing protein [Deltaproteobacteria bacterium]|nr:3-hydroxyacyl-CoA dehydrogenase NAD-binding domain-containing protein [Deltaproteobacteria bacterium]
MIQIKKAAVIGSGVMGSGIAAHLANCGIPSYLLDVVLPDLSKILKARPAHLYDADDIKLITPGLLDANLEKLKECDWIIEVVTEKLDVKKALYKKIAPYIKDSAWVSSNTSGLPLHELKFRDKFCITHFFNPPRYLKLVEVVGDASELAKFIEEKLGKGVVQAKDTPNFIANRIGVYHVFDCLHMTADKNWPIEKVEKVMGPATLHPKSAAFRTCDLVGLDTLALVAKTCYDGCPKDECRDTFKAPAFLEKMIAKGLLGEKTKQGFYKVAKTDAGKEILAINLQTLEYGPQQKFRADSLGKAKEIENPAERLKAVVFADDEAGQIAWPLISNMLVYAANRIPEISDSIEDVDDAMRWGFNWELGPFEMWDALGVSQVVERLQKENRGVPKLVQDILKKGGQFYPKPKLTFLKSRKASAGAVVEQNSGGSIVDLGEGVFCAEFHSKMNALDGDVLEIINKGLERADKEGKGLVITNEGENFSVGANILLILLTAQQKDWNQLDFIVREFQKTMQKIRFSPKPVVAAPFNLALGGGCEVCLAATDIVAHAETYMGLVEVGVGLLPAGCGCKNMLLRWEEKLVAEHNPKDKIWASPEDGGPFPKVQKCFEAIAMGKVSTSAKEAKKLGYFKTSNSIVLNRDNLTQAAKQRVLELSKNYQPPKMQENIQLPGKGGEMALINGAHSFFLQGLISEYDLFIAKTIAHVLAGGDKPSIHTTNEQHILDLEREAFLKLCGEEKSQARIQQMLMTGKPLRN